MLWCFRVVFKYTQFSVLRSSKTLILSTDYGSFCFVRLFVRSFGRMFARWGFIEFTHRTARYTLNEVDTCTHKICINGEANQFQWKMCVSTMIRMFLESVLCYCLLLSESFPIYYMDVCERALVCRRKTVWDQNEWGVVGVTNRIDTENIRIWLLLLTTMNDNTHIVLYTLLF